MIIFVSVPTSTVSLTAAAVPDHSGTSPSSSTGVDNTCPSSSDMSDSIQALGNTPIKEEVMDLVSERGH
jgi:hypothetical protein